MAVTLELRHLWTRTGGALTWRFDAPDDRDLRDLLARLGDHVAEADKRSAVLIAIDDEIRVIGAWNRAGAAQLQALIEAIPRSEGWMDLRAALHDGVTGP
jgi:hypothetical protein